MIRRQIMGHTDQPSTKLNKAPTINPSVASDVVKELPENIFTQKLNLLNVTTIKQRLNNPSLQPITVNNLYPQHKSLSIKRSVRCRQCDHYVIKPEFNPISIKYRIHLLASYHVPEVRLMKNYKFNVGESGQIKIKLINPTIHDMTITIMELPTRDEETLIIEEMKKKFDEPLAVSSPSVGSAFATQPSLMESPKYVEQQVTGNIVLPDSSFLLQHRDDSTEYDEYVINQQDPKFVVWRRYNKVIIELTVNPLNCKSGDEVMIGFSMQYNYVNTVPNTPDKKEPQKHALTSRVYIRVGEVN